MSTVATDFASKLAPLVELGERAGIPSEHLRPYGFDLAKVDLEALDTSAPQRAHYVVVTATSPTPYGEGKTTTAIGLVQGLALEGASATLTIRQPSMGPTFGVKGGAAGSGKSQVLPFERMNLHLTGDFHAITAAHNLLSAMIDNHLHQGNELHLKERSITWPRVLDVNDRSLRHVVTGLGGAIDGVTRQASFDITAASEVMVIMSLATSYRDLRERLGRIVIGQNEAGEYVTAEDLKAAGAMAALLRDALSPNLLRTTEGSPVLVHTGPFGNIATGCSSVSDFVVTEAGFGADMGAERFFNIKCPLGGLRPDCAVIVTTVRALKSHSGHYKLAPGKALPEAMLEENVEEVRVGSANLLKHIEIVRGFGLNPVIAINVFPTDHEAELAEIEAICSEAGVRVARSLGVVEGGEGARALAREVQAACEESDPSAVHPLYEDEDSLKEKIAKVAAMYGAAGVDYTPAAAKRLKEYQEAGYGNLKVVVAKTPMSLSADPQAKGAPTGWTLPIREVRLAAGAGYVYAISGTLSTMPGLSAHPAAERIELTEDGVITGVK